MRIILCLMIMAAISVAQLPVSTSNWTSSLSILGTPTKPASDLYRSTGGVCFLTVVEFDATYVDVPYGPIQSPPSPYWSSAPGVFGIPVNLSEKWEMLTYTTQGNNAYVKWRYTQLLFVPIVYDQDGDPVENPGTMYLNFAVTASLNITKTFSYNCVN